MPSITYTIKGLERLPSVSKTNWFTHTTYFKYSRLLNGSVISDWQVCLPLKFHHHCWPVTQYYLWRTIPCASVSYVKWIWNLQTKYNLPSWCDRILRKSYPLAHVVSHAYGEWFPRGRTFPDLQTETIESRLQSSYPTVHYILDANRLRMIAKGLWRVYWSASKWKVYFPQSAANLILQFLNRPTQ